MTLPLAERYPGLAAMPHAGISQLPTPVDNAGDLLPLDSESEELYPIHGLWVKRDDVSSAVYGGNKIRKLDYLLGEALAQGRKAVITFGAYGSNHALATAVHARALGLEPHVVLSPQEPGPFAAATLLAHAGLGTVIHPVEGWDGRREAVLAKQELIARDGIEPYIIPMGGTCALGAVGYVEAAFEVAFQVRELDLPGLTVALGDFVRPDVVYVAAGTMGTAVGLAVGFAAASQHTRVVAVRVTPSEICNLEIARTLAEETVALLRSYDSGFPELRFEELNFELRDDWFEPGYGVVTPESLEAVELAAAGGLALETTYTGRAFAAMLADAKAGKLADEHVLFWDTYSSAAKPAAGPVESLPPVLQAYVAECEQRFGSHRPRT